MSVKILIHVLHITGTWMNQMVIDGMLREDFLERVIAGEDPLLMILMNKGELERESLIEDWIRIWRRQELSTALNAKGWLI